MCLRIVYVCVCNCHYIILYKIAINKTYNKFQTQTAIRKSVQSNQLRNINGISLSL